MRRPGVIFLIVSMIIGYIFFLISGDMKVDSKPQEICVTITGMSERRYTIVYISDDVEIIYKGKKKPNISIGDVISCKCVEKNMSRINFEKFDYGKYLKSTGIKKVYEMKEYKKIGNNKFYTFVGKIRKSIIETNIILYREKAGFLNGMTVGDKNFISKEDKYIFMDSGTSHVIAISGLHVSIIYTIIGIFYGKMRNIKSFLLISSLLIFYSKIVGGGASVMRAIYLIILIFISFLIDERFDIVNLISIIAGFMIIENPYIIYNISFQLSFLSIASISVLNKYLKKLFYGNVIPSTISATLATAPIVLYSFDEISTMGILGNIIAIPAAGIILLIDFVDILLYICGFYSSYILAELNIFIIDIMIFLLRKIGNYGVGNIILKDKSIKYIVIYYLVFFILMIFMYIFKIIDNIYSDEDVF